MFVLLLLGFRKGNSKRHVIIYSLTYNLPNIIDPNNLITYSAFSFSVPSKNIILSSPKYMYINTHFHYLMNKKFLFCLPKYFGFSFPDPHHQPMLFFNSHHFPDSVIWIYAWLTRSHILVLFVSLYVLGFRISLWLCAYVILSLLLFSNDINFQTRDFMHLAPSLVLTTFFS